MFRTCHELLGRSAVECGNRATRRVYSPSPITGWLSVRWVCPQCAAEILTIAQVAVAVR